MCNSYNGWSSYEAWCVSLWIDNDQGYQEYWRESCEEACKDKGNRDDAVNEIRRQLQDLHEENMPEVTGVYRDLLTAALGNVDWYEIAEKLVDEIEYKFEDEDDDEDCTPEESLNKLAAMKW